jgi:anti-anti-sigma factor
MEITVSDFGASAAKVVLVGTLDIVGADKIDMPLAALAGTRRSVVVDMTSVDFIASIGIRHLVMAAKAIARGHGKLIILAPNPAVTAVLMSAGVDEILPIVASESEAQETLAQTLGQTLGQPDV